MVFIMENVNTCLVYKVLISNLEHACIYVQMHHLSQEYKQVKIWK